MPEPVSPQRESSTEAGAMSALTAVVARLQSQPLLFGIGVLLILVIVLGLAADRFSMLVLPALVIFVLGVAAWLAIELPKARAKAAAEIARTTPPSVGNISVSARRVGEKGSVTGIEGLPTNHVVGSGVRVEAEEIEGRVGGVAYRTPQKREDEHDSAGS